MKKLLAAALACAAAALAGCGGGPKIPADTVAAAYVDVEKTIENAIDVAKDFIGEMPKDKRKEAREQLDRLLDEHKGDFKALAPEWFVITAGGSPASSDPRVAAVLKCRYAEKLSSGVSLEDALPMAGFSPDGEIGGAKAFKGSVPVPAFLGAGDDICVALVEGKYVIFSDNRGTLESFVALYKDGKGDTSDDFDDLDDLDGDTIARVQTASVGTIADIAGARELVETFGKECDDEDLAEAILDGGSVTFDVKFSDSVVGARLSVDAGSKDMAKLVEGLFAIAAFAGRVGADAGAVASDMVKGVAGAEAAKAQKAAAPLLRKAAEADRSGSVATLTVEVDTDDLLELVVPALFE